MGKTVIFNKSELANTILGIEKTLEYMSGSINTETALAYVSTWYNLIFGCEVPFLSNYLDLLASKSAVIKSDLYNAWIGLQYADDSLNAGIKYKNVQVKIDYRIYPDGNIPNSVTVTGVQDYNGNWTYIN